MAKLGMRYPVAAKRTETDGVVSYSEGRVLGKAISSNTTIETYEAPLYGDDAIAEMESGFKSGTVNLNTTHLSLEDQSFLLGHLMKDIEIAATTVKEMTANADDEAPFVGYGFYGAIKVDNVRKYRAVWMRKVKFSEPNDENETQGENIAWKTPTINGVVAKEDDGEWKDEVIVETESLAKTWLNGKANITG